jgi:hypothetical protein
VSNWTFEHFSADSVVRDRFISAQRQHDCLDCGWAYLADDWTRKGSAARQVFGAGSIVFSADQPIRELHIVPHGGNELPDEFLADLSPDRMTDLVALVHDNSDLGTGAVYRSLVDKIVRGEITGAAVAGFHLSRLLVDCNRADPTKQTPRQPYVGTSELYADYLDSTNAMLRAQALQPWLDGVNELLELMGEAGNVYHHHTYDLFTMSHRPYDFGEGMPRPAFQLIWNRTPSGELSTDDNDRGLAPLAKVETIAAQISEFLSGEFGIPDPAGAIDYPLGLPLAPFHGMRHGENLAPSHFAYDMRKDVLTSEARVQAWVTSAPWMLAKDADVPGIGREAAILP